MCGICGKLIYAEAEPSRDLIDGMCSQLEHRGPDDQGIHTDTHIGLGQKRLSIIDLSKEACPPLSNEDNTIWVILNGEIYNFIELKESLLQKGHRFRTNSDTEVIVHLYEEEGIDCIKNLHGMFAIAIWDGLKKKLFCVRDRLGKKPLFYTSNGKSFLFASEIKSITADPEISIEPNFEAIDLFLTTQSVPSPGTAFQGIKKLGPGEILSCNTNHEIEIWSYWSPPIANPAKFTREEFDEKVIEKLRESVRKRMIADVPLGAFLSGGIDSGLIVGLMAQESNKQINTYTIGFEEDEKNELPWAKKQAELHGTNHTELIVKPDVLDILPKLVWHYNEPFADSSAIPSYYVSKIASEYVTVALSGDGGDETFAGYSKYYKMTNWNRLDSIPLPLRRSVGLLGHSLLHPFSHFNTAAKLRRGFEMISAKSIRERYEVYHSIVKKDEKKLLYSKEFSKKLAFRNENKMELARVKGESDIDWMMRHDQSYYLPEVLLVKADIASMANSLEVRSPFLDHEMIEFAAQIPIDFKRDGNSGKAIIRRAAKDLLHPSLLEKRKTGFSLPVGNWLRGPMAPFMKEILLSEKCIKRNIFNQKALEKMINEHINQRRSWSNRLWALIMLELWFITFID